MVYIIQAYREIWERLDEPRSYRLYHNIHVVEEDAATFSGGSTHS